MIKNYLLENLKTTDFREVAKAVLEIQAEAFPKVDASMISQLFEDVTAILRVLSGIIRQWTPFTTTWNTPYK